MFVKGKWQIWYWSYLIGIVIHSAAHTCKKIKKFSFYVSKHRTNRWWHVWEFFFKFLRIANNCQFEIGKQISNLLHWNCFAQLREEHYKGCFHLTVYIGQHLTFVIFQKTTKFMVVCDLNRVLIYIHIEYMHLLFTHIIKEILSDVSITVQSRIAIRRLCQIIVM